jgi:20S proteasome alpha/beta subunit
MLIPEFNLNNSINYEDNINIDILDNLTLEEDMTTIIAVKCNEGIIIASDSQSTAGNTKNLMTSKIFQVNKFAGVGCAGFIGHINNLVNKMKEKSNDELMTDLDTKKNINDGLLELHKQYNIEHPKKAGYNTVIHNLKSSGIFGIKLKDNTFGLDLLLPSGKEFAIPYLLPINDYTSVGSGSVYAHLLLKTQFRVMTTVAQQPISSIPLKFLLWVVTYVINEIKETYTYSGGHTDISIINKDGYLNISKDTILKHYDEGI